MDIKDSFKSVSMAVLELTRIIILFILLGAIGGYFLDSIYSSIGANPKYFWLGYIAIIILFFVLYRNKLQFSGWYKGKEVKKLPKSPSRTLIFIAIILLILPPILMNDNNIQAVKKDDLNQLTRVDVEVFKNDTYEKLAKIEDEQTIESLRRIFKQISWEPNAEVKIAGPEDAKLILHFKNGEKVSEGFPEYLIFFNTNTDLATIVSNHPAEGLGTLENDLQTLSDFLLKE